MYAGDVAHEKCFQRCTLERKHKYVKGQSDPLYKQQVIVGRIDALICKKVSHVL